VSSREPTFILHDKITLTDNSEPGIIAVRRFESLNVSPDEVNVFLLSSIVLINP
jgi:hypothetical protein